ncbi:hypothetical protein F4677DRAFT_317145 [Hypoxylon crocopeplum]|nr:hypothetical protein F4677DRAFT_317145 [Hypoxylon crocopeplum]
MRSELRRYEKVSTGQKHEPDDGSSGSGQRLSRRLKSLLSRGRGSEVRDLLEAPSGSGNGAVANGLANPNPQAPAAGDARFTHRLSTDELDVSLNMWNEAYEKVREKNATMVEAYEKILLTNHIASNAVAKLAAATIVNFVDCDPAVRMARMKNVATKALGQFEKHAAVKENVVEATNIVKELAGFIKGFLDFCPPAAFALSGISAALPILVKPLEADQDMVDALQYIMDSLEWYIALCRLTLRGSWSDGMDDEQFRLCRDVLRGRIVSLYVSLLEFQVKCVCRCYHDNPLLVGIKVILGRINWKAERELIQVRVEGINSELTAFNLEKAVKFLEGMTSNSHNILLTIRRLETFIQDARNAKIREEKEERQKYQSVLTGRFMTSPDYKRQLSLNSVREENTCEWFCNHNTFRKWLDGTGSDVLLVSAYPGCGKSVLASHLIQTVIPQEKPDVTVCYYFFKDNADESKLANAYSALLHCLFTANGTLADACKTTIEQSGLDVREHEDSLWKIFAEATGRATCGPVVCIVDALDECVEEGIKTLSLDLLALYEQLEKRKRPDSKGGPNIKFLLTTRGYPSILNKFQKLRPYNHLSGEGDQEINAIQNEISLVVKGRLNELAKAKGLTSGQKNALRQRLSKHGKGQKTYLWVKLVFEVLMAAYPENNDKWKSFVDNLPETVSEAYARLLKKVPPADRKSAMDLLNIVLVAYRPLSLQEVNIAINVRNHPSKSSLADLNMTTKEHFRDWVINTCGFVVAEYGGKIYFIHQTVRDFLLRKGDSQMNQSSTSLLGFLGPSDGFSWRLGLAEAHRTMAESCISYLSLKMCKSGEMRRVLNEFIEKMRENLLQWPQKTWARIASYTFADYAISFWPAHLRHGQQFINGTLSADIQDVYLPHYLSLIRDFETKSHPGILVTARSQDIATLWNDLGTDSRYTSDGTDYSRCILSSVSEPGTPQNLNDAYFGLADNMAGLAALWGHFRVLRDRVDLNTIPEIDQQGGSWWSPLVSLITAKPSQIQQFDHTSDPLLYYAVTGKSVPCLEYLLKCGFDPDDKLHSGQTAMHLASSSCSDDIVECLLKYGATADISDDNGRTPLSVVLQSSRSVGEREVVARLLVVGKDGRKANLSAVDEDRNTPLHLAASIDWGNQYGQLRRDHPDPYSKEAQGGGFLGFLVDNGASVNARNKADDTPLMVACRQGKAVNVVNVTQLLQSGADPNLAGSDGFSPLVFAITEISNASTMDIVVRREAIALALLEHGADPNKKTPSGTPILVVACGLHRIEEPEAALVGALLDRGADSSVRLREDGPMLLQHVMAKARSPSREECVIQFIRKGSDPNEIVEPNSLRTLLHEACESLDTYLIRRLIDRNANIEARDSQGQTPLHLLFSLLCRKPWGPWLCDNNLPWMEKAIRLLLWKGASVTVRDNEGRTPIDLLGEVPQRQWVMANIPGLFEENIDHLREPRLTDRL